ncbi:uncharacterized protein LOC119104795 [Pollicipes pollicipes]|uniref:uncharacterized protein LOC119104795 n=1 Tax=Pollicipes pollicipes TaxID=41117 RepID=UPI0018853723|nr:uncharacterized protein LOC119104795 [Pollicipes pollicipes]
MQRNRCRRCDEPGHMAAACRLPPVCLLCGLKGHSGEFRCPNMFCYMCGRPDHPTERCPRHIQQVFCALCKANGHVSDSCPDRWRRYHATTSADCAPVQPPAPLDSWPPRSVSCWQCGVRGHPGHQCGDERYTSLASLSQRVISYTSATCESSAVSGLVATPAQMEAVFGRRRRQRLEADTGATLTYEQLGASSWLINFTGSHEAAGAARAHVLDTLQGGGGRSRPRPRSEPSSPVRSEAETGPASAPPSPQPALARERRRLEKQARRELKAIERKKKRARRRDERRAAAAAAAAAKEGETVAEAGDGEAAGKDGAVVAEEVILSDSASPSPHAGEQVTDEEVVLVAEVRHRRPLVQLVTVVSDDEEELDRSALAKKLRHLRKKMLRSLRRGGAAAGVDDAPRPDAGDQDTGGGEDVQELRPAGAAGAGAEAERAQPPRRATTPRQNGFRPPTDKAKEKRQLKVARVLKRKLTADGRFRLHLPEGWETRQNWRKVLKSHGILKLSAPGVAETARLRQAESASQAVNGYSQEALEQLHKHGYTYAPLTKKQRNEYRKQRELAQEGAKSIDFRLLTRLETLPVTEREAALMPLFDDEWTRKLRCSLQLPPNADLTAIIGTMEAHLHVASIDGDARLPTNLDAVMGDSQVPIAEEPQDLTCFTT